MNVQVFVHVYSVWVGDVILFTLLTYCTCMSISIFLCICGELCFPYRFFVVTQVEDAHQAGLKEEEAIQIAPWLHCLKAKVLDFFCTFMMSKPVMTSR